MRPFCRVFVTVLIAALPLAAPAPASADILLTGFAGASFLPNNQEKLTYGATLGLGGLIGLEFDVARTELGSFARIPSVDLDAHMTTYMGNLFVRLPAGPVQPYVSGGAGLVRITGSVDVPFLGNLVSISGDDFGWNVGGGVMFFPSSNIGIRADVRRFETTDLSWNELTNIGGLDDLPLPEVNFWRVTGGVTFKF